MKILNLTKAFRVSENRVLVLYYHNERHQEFVCEWNNIHPGTGEIIDYDLQINCLSGSAELNEMIKNTIAKGEHDDNPNLDLYLELRDTFNANDCEDA